VIEPTTIEDREEGHEERPCAVLGVIVAPGLAHDVTSRIASELLDDVRERYDSVDWRTELQVDRLVVPPAPLTEFWTPAGASCSKATGISASSSPTFR
jgi:hypothetical protein